MKKIYFITLFCLAIGCKNQKDYQELIKGDWHSGIMEELINSNDNQIDTLYSYYEYAFTNEYAYTYSEVAGFIFPQKYEIKNDSMFLYVMLDTIKDITRSGKIVFQNEDQFDFITKFGTYSNYRIKETDKGLSNYVIPDSLQNVARFDSSSNSFHLIFRERYNKKVTNYLQDKK